MGCVARRLLTGGAIPLGCALAVLWAGPASAEARLFTPDAFELSGDVRLVAVARESDARRQARREQAARHRRVDGGQRYIGHASNVPRLGPSRPHHARFPSSTIAAARQRHRELPGAIHPSLARPRAGLCAPARLLRQARLAAAGSYPVRTVPL